MHYERLRFKNIYVKIHIPCTRPCTKERERPHRIIIAEICTNCQSSFLYIIFEKCKLRGLHIKVVVNFKILNGNPGFCMHETNICSQICLNINFHEVPSSSFNFQNSVIFEDHLKSAFRFFRSDSTP